ncbi:GAF domain-containing protein [Microbacterium oxydans]|uniref:GAF domain-containing protein n=1 Tax=Microbacterium oxydans TaxID=82380 RepID=UPI0036708FC5
MRSRDDRVPAGAAVERALVLGVCGLGGRLDAAPEGLTDALVAVDLRHGERTARRIERFAAAPDGALVWTRDADGLFWLGALDGPWRFDASFAADEVDLVHVRPCRWLAEPLPSVLVPAGVKTAFERGGRNWQRIRDGEAAAASVELQRRLATA